MRHAIVGLQQTVERDLGRFLAANYALPPEGPPVMFPRVNDEQIVRAEYEDSHVDAESNHIICLTTVLGIWKQVRGRVLSTTGEPAGSPST